MRGRFPDGNRGVDFSISTKMPETAQLPRFAYLRSFTRAAMLSPMSTATAPDMAEKARAWLVAYQESEGISGRELAARIGIREQDWSRIRNGHRRIAPIQRERACLAFPALRELLFEEAS